MRVARVQIENFRGIRSATLHFAGTTVLLGDNNTGKSTVFEAIELAIGADRLARHQVIDEHDFFGGAYKAAGDQPAPQIVIEVVIADLDAEHCQRFRANLEFWREADNRLLGAGEARQVAQEGVVPGEWAHAPHLRVSELTREDLRRVLKSFLATGVEGYAAPFQHQGSGTINALVLSMLGLIAERRRGRVIFAMEEPELSLPPHVQQRVVDKVRGLASQALFTSHSPYVIEQFEPDQMTVMRRDMTGVMSATPVSLPANLKLKLFRDGFRTRFCEALLARRVVVVGLGSTPFPRTV